MSGLDRFGGERAGFDCLVSSWIVLVVSTEQAGLCYAKYFVNSKKFWNTKKIVMFMRINV